MEVNKAITIPEITIPTEAKGAPEEREMVIVNKMGRPEKYRPIFKKYVQKYLKECRDEWEQIVKSETEKGTNYEVKNKVRLPSMQGFAKFLGVSLDSVKLWRKKYPDFSSAVKEIEIEQFERLANNGLGGQYEPKIAALLLSANHGIRSNENDARDNGNGSTNINITYFAPQSNPNVKIEAKKDN